MPLSRTLGRQKRHPTANPPQLHIQSERIHRILSIVRGNTLPQGFVLKLPPLITCKLPRVIPQKKVQPAWLCNLEVQRLPLSPPRAKDTPVGWPLIKLMMFDDSWSRFHRRFRPLTIWMWKWGPHMVNHPPLIMLHSTCIRKPLSQILEADL